MDAIKAFRPSYGVARVQAAAEPRATGQGQADATGVGPPEIIDEVTLSHEVRIRQDVAQASEQTRHQDPEDDVPTAASVADHERLRQMVRTDLETRGRDDAPSAGNRIRMLPMFEVAIGPLGRAYAVDEGLEFEAPEAPPPPVHEDVRPGFESDTGPPEPFAESQLDPLADDFEPPSRDDVELSESPGASRAGRVTHEWVDTEPIRSAGPEPPAEELPRFELPQQARAEQTAQAYQRAAALTGAPSGSGSEFEAFA